MNFSFQKLIRFNFRLQYFFTLFAVLILSIEVSAQETLFDKIKNMSDSVSMENLIRHIKELEYAGGHYSRVNFTPGNDSAVVYIKSELEKVPGLTSVELDTFYISSAISPYNTKPVFNVVATIEGKGNPKTSYVVGAHLDCSASRMGSSIWQQQWRTIKAPGADDNATGVAALLEMARLLADTSFGLVNDYTIKLVAFGAEESGPGYQGSHHGSRHFAKNARTNNENILGAVSIDMIGFNEHYDFTAIVSNNNSKTFGEKFVEAKDLFFLDLLMNESPFTYGTYSDHASFWDEGYQAILFIEYGPPWENGPYYAANPYYHTSADSFGTLNMELVKKVTQLNLVTIASFAARLTDVQLAANEILPGEYYLYQNYPNPFNPTTKIRYAVASKASGEFVSLKVFDVLGRETAVLVNEVKPAGMYEVEFNADKLNSGVYFCRLSIGFPGQVNSFSQVKKMILSK
jgi:hypothetical protein